MPTTYRGKKDIIYDILREMKIYHKRTHLMNRTIITWKQFNYYSELILVCHLAKKENKEYFLTQEGFSYIIQYEKLEEFFKQSQILTV